MPGNLKSGCNPSAESNAAILPSLCMVRLPPRMPQSTLTGSDQPAPEELKMRQAWWQIVN